MSTARFDATQGTIEIAIPTGWLVAVAVLLHGPVDVGLTLLAWHLESNPVVTALGVSGFLTVKTTLLAALVAVWASLDRSASPLEHLAERGLAVVLTVCVAIGLSHVALNAWLLAYHSLHGVLPL